MQSDDPLKEIQRLMLHTAEHGVAGGSLLQGCPLNNLAQEMSALDEGFRQRLEKIYVAWRAALKTSLTNAIKTGKVRKDISPGQVSAFVVAALTGIIGTVKNAQNEKLLREAGAGLLDYMDSLRR